MKKIDKIYTKNLTQTWMHVVVNVRGIELKDAVGIMNKSLNSRHKLSRIKEWSDVSLSRRGTRTPREVRIYMSKYVIKYVMYCCNIPETKVNTNRLIKMLH